MGGPLSPVVRKCEPDDSARIARLPNVRQWIGFMIRGSCPQGRFDLPPAENEYDPASDSDSRSSPQRCPLVR